jgi:hypothetical protein
VKENGKQQGQIPVAFVTMASVAEAATILESAKQEPFVLEGRSLRVNWANRTNSRPPSKTVYFKNFNDGDLGKLRDFLGDLSGSVDKAWFSESCRSLGICPILTNVCSRGQVEQGCFPPLWHNHLSRY